MKALAWVAAGVMTGALLWTMAPDIRRYLKMHAM
jgi:hypothetical protein